MKKKQLGALAALLGVGLAFFAPSAVLAAAAGHDQSIVMASDATFPPFDYVKNGKVMGFDIDMMRDIAKVEHLDITFKPMPFNGIVPSLQSGAVNAAVSGMIIKQGRLKRVDFSNAYFRSGLSILVRKGSSIQGFDDLKNHVVAAKKATAGAAYLISHGVPLSHIKQFQNLGAAYQSLESGGADAVFFDNQTNVMFKAKHDNVKIVGGLLEGSYYGIAVSKKNPQLATKFNDGLAKIMKNGQYHQLFVKWFDGDASGEVHGVMKPEAVAVSSH